jgi:hypothetical protein
MFPASVTATAPSVKCSRYSPMKPCSSNAVTSVSKRRSRLPSSSGLPSDSPSSVQVASGSKLKLSVRYSTTVAPGGSWGGGGRGGGGGTGRGAIKQTTGPGPMSHGRSHLSNALESGHGNSVRNEPPTFVREMEYPTSDTSHPDPTVPSKGEVEPDDPAADKATTSDNTAPSQAMLTAAVTVVSVAGAST